METVGAVLLVSGSVAVVLWIMLRKLGIGRAGSSPDCGCGSGSKCKTNSRNKKRIGDTEP